MKKLYQYRLPLKNGTFRDGMILQIGECFGDIAPLPGFSRETFQAAKEEAIRLLPSSNPNPILPSVRFGFDCAQQPLPSTIDLPINALNHHRPGFRALKLKIGHLSLDEAIALIRQIPKSVELRLDFNRRWPLEKLLQFASHFSPTDFAYLEEPTAKFADLLSFSTLTDFPVAIDESSASFPYWEIPTLKTLVIKPTIVGTVPHPPPNVELILSSAYESGIGLLHLARLALQHNPLRPHGLDPYTHLAEDLVHPAPTILNGSFLWKSDGKLLLEHPSLCLIASAP